jgi:hypothetical protein
MTSQVNRTATFANRSMRTKLHVCAQKMTRPRCTEKALVAQAPGVYSTKMRFEAVKPPGSGGMVASQATTPCATAWNTVSYRFGSHL